MAAFAAHYLSFRLTQNGHCRIFKASTGQVWDANAGALGLITAVTAANAAVSVVYTAAHKAGLVVLPSALPNGVDYILAIYNEATGSNTDEAVDLVRFVKEEWGFTFSGSIVTSWKS
jgi:hypothetical protein